MKISALRRRFLLALAALATAFVAMAAATFAWYIYNTSAHTTRVHMAAGTSVALYISNRADGPFSSAAVLDAFAGRLNPVSTNRIQGGFQKVYGYTNVTENQGLLANLFTKSEDADYYKTTVYLKTDGPDLQVYLADLGKPFFEDSDPANPISTAIRVGFVDTTTGQEYIFAINPAKNPEARHNTATGQPGWVLENT
ncbi:MAG: hypothetical protein PHO10_09680 [Gemmiger sp.]|nr:hypothetical protein [Gemmiger sp.]